MGKKKRDKKSKQVKHSPTGIEMVKDDEDDLSNRGAAETIKNILSELQSHDERTRDYACSQLACMANAGLALPQLLSKEMIRTLSPLVVDKVPSVRNSALEAIRNMTVQGGLDYCHDMVMEDVLTPLVALFKMYERDWVPEKEKSRHMDTQVDTFTKAVLILWNLCEASEIAVAVFNKENLLPHLLPCLQHSVYGYRLATAVAQCLHTATECNEEAKERCHSDDVLPTLQLLAQRNDNSTMAVLYQAALMGVLMNVLGEKMSSWPGLPHFVGALAKILDLDWLPFIAAGSAKNHVQENAAEPQPGSSGDTNHSQLLLEQEGGDYEDLLNVLDAQGLCLEMTNNICTSPEEEWEDLEESSMSSEEMEVTDVGADNNNDNKPKVPVEVLEALAAHNIFGKVLRFSLPVSKEILAGVKSKQWNDKVTKRLTHLRSRALHCINILVEEMSVETLGGMDTLHQLWDALGPQLLSAAAASSSCTTNHQQSGSTDSDLLDAVARAMRVVLDKLGKLKSPKFQQVTVEDVHTLSKLAEGLEQGMQVLILRILGSVAFGLVATEHPDHAVVQEVGGLLLSAAANNADLVIVSEALDAVFDIFGHDNADSVIQTLKVVDRLEPLVPQFKEKMQRQRKSLGENYQLVTNTKTNLSGFIQYCKSRTQS